MYLEGEEQRALESGRPGPGVVTFEIVTKLCNFVPPIGTDASCEQGTWGPVTLPPCLGPLGCAAHHPSCGEPPPHDVCFLSDYKVGMQTGPQKPAVRSK